jgi:hypothetical protein
MRGAQLDQMSAAAKPFADRAVLWRGDRDRRHQIASAELGENAGIDLVGLAGPVWKEIG